LQHGNAEEQQAKTRQRGAQGPAVLAGAGQAHQHTQADQG